MVDVINERGGCFTLQDLEKYEPKIRTTVKTSYHNYDIVSFGPPSGGCAVIEMLNILENKDIRKTGCGRDHEASCSIFSAITQRARLSFTSPSIPFTARVAEKGYFPKEELLNLRKINHMLQGHPDKAFLPK